MKAKGTCYVILCRETQIAMHNSHSFIVLNLSASCKRIHSKKSIFSCIFTRDENGHGNGCEVLRVIFHENFLFSEKECVYEKN